MKKKWISIAVFISCFLGVTAAVHAITVHNENQNIEFYSDLFDDVIYKSESDINESMMIYKLNGDKMSFVSMQNIFSGVSEINLGAGNFYKDDEYYYTFIDMDKMTAIEIIDMEFNDKSEIKIENDRAVVQLGKEEINLKKLSPAPDYTAPKIVNDADIADIIENKDIIYSENGRKFDIIKSASIDVTDMFDDMDGSGIKSYFYRKSDTEDTPYSQVQPGQDGRYIISDIPGDYSYEIYAEDYCGLKSEKMTLSGHVDIYKPMELSSEITIYNEDGSLYTGVTKQNLKVVFNAGYNGISDVNDAISTLKLKADGEGNANIDNIIYNASDNTFSANIRVDNDKYFNGDIILLRNDNYELGRVNTYIEKRKVDIKFDNNNVWYFEGASKYNLGIKFSGPIQSDTVNISLLNQDVDTIGVSKKDDYYYVARLVCARDENLKFQIFSSKIKVSVTDVFGEIHTLETPNELIITNDKIAIENEEYSSDWHNNEYEDLKFNNNSNKKIQFDYKIKNKNDLKIDTVKSNDNINISNITIGKDEIYNGDIDIDIFAYLDTQDGFIKSSIPTNRIIHLKNIKIDNEAPQIQQAQISSSTFKNNDKLTLTLNTTENRGSGIDTNSINFTMNATQISGDKVNWNDNNGVCTCELTVKEKDGLAEIYGKDENTPIYSIKNDNEEIKITDIYASDKVGNKGNSYTGNVSSVYYAPLEKAFEKDTLIFSSDNASPFKYAIDGNTLNVSFSTTHPVGIKNVKLAGNDIHVDGYSTEWGFSCKIDENQDIKDNSDIDFTFTLFDEAGNEEISKTQKNSSNQIIYYAPLKESCKSLSFISDNEKAGLVKNSDVLTLSLNASHKVNIKKLEVAGESVNTDKSVFIDKWNIDYVVMGDEKIKDNSKVEFRFVLCDEAGNIEYDLSDDNIDDKDSITYYAPIENVFDDFRFESDNKVNNLARNGDTLTVSFTTTHPINISEAKINGISENTVISNYVYDNGKYSYSVKYIIKNDSDSYVFSDDNQIISFDIKLDDDAGNKSCQKNEHSYDTDLDEVSQVIYYAPLQTSITNISIKSDNIKSNLVKNNDIVTVNFTAGHPVDLHNVKIAGKNAQISSEDNDRMHWTISYRINNNNIPDNTAIPFEMFISDESGNGVSSNNEYTFKKDNTNTMSKVTYYAPIEIKTLQMISDNQVSGQYVARNGNNITLQFQTTHPVNIREMKIAGKKAEFSSENNDRMHWTVSYTVSDGDTADNDKIKLYFVTGDDAGNADVESNENRDIIYYAPIVISDVTFSSDNAKNGNAYAKDGDTITVNFTSNHDVQTSGVLVSGKPADISSYNDGIKEIHTITYRLNNGDCIDQSDVTFNFRADDIAGNDPVINTDYNAQGVIRYYAPLTQKTVISGSGKNKKFIRNGDTVTVSVNTNHEAFFTSSQIFSRTASTNGNNTSGLSANIVIPLNENELQEGNVTFDYSIADVAGNVIERVKTAESGVVYDKSLPDVTLMPKMSGFMSKEVKYTVTFSDVNLDADTVSFIINGEEQINDDDRQMIRNGVNTYSKDITVDTPDKTEKSFTVSATAKDKAGNQCIKNPASGVTIDKLSPKVKINLEDIIIKEGRVVSTPRVFEKGIVLADLFTIDENNIQTIDCIIDDVTGIYPWNIKKPIMTDGKKIISLQVKDFAGNQSSEIIYTLLIDGMEPKIIVEEDHSKKMLTLLDQGKTFKSETMFKISLSDMAIGDETPDYIKSAYLRTPDGEKIDILDTESPYTIDFQMLSNKGYKDGDYALLINATDVKGNETGETKFTFTFKNQNFIQKLFSNPAFCGITIGLLIMAVFLTLGYKIFKKINDRIEAQIPK